MKNISFKYENAMIPHKEILKIAENVEPEIENMNLALSKGYEDERASINLPDDRNALEGVQETIREKTLLKPEYLIVIGIGGSNLGTIAVQEAVLGKYYNQRTTATKVLYADTVDSDHINFIIETIEPVMEKGRSVILNVISKSGTTTETVANFQIILACLKKNIKEYQKCVVITSDKNLKLWNIALRERFSVLEIPEKVGGRYSVFSPVGLFPLGLVGVNLKQLLDGARNMRDICINKDVEENPAVISASIQYFHHKNGKNISDLFLFSNDLESMGKWYRQLLGESLGKEFSKNGRKVNAGLTPTVSIGSTDLHSVAQLYLGGPYDKFTTFVRVEKNNFDVVVPNLKGYSNLVPGIQGKSLGQIMGAILGGTEKAFAAKGRPFVEVTLPDKSEYSIGQFLQFKMMETIYLGYLLNVNPFGQPNVEYYKTETRKILSE